MHLETIGATVTAPGAGPTALAAVTGDALTTKAGRLGSRIYIIAACFDQQAVGMLQITYPSGHDTTRGLRLRGTAATGINRMSPGTRMPVNIQELISLSASGSAVAGDVENATLTVWYEDVPGLNARLIDVDELDMRAEKFLSVDASITATVGGTWSAAEALNAESDLLLPNRDYAILGADFQTQASALGIRGPDTANVRVAIPACETQPLETRDWFVALSKTTGLQTIPIINSGNKGNTLLDVLQDENLAACLFTLNLALLRE